MRPESLREAKDWLARAKRDLMVVELSVHGSPPLTDAAAYHAQQAVEKALKAFLAACEQSFPKTHDLVHLVGWCGRLDSDFSRFQEAARILTPYAAQFRYPGGPLEPKLEDAQEASRIASTVVKFVEQRLGVTTGE